MKIFILHRITAEEEQKIINNFKGKHMEKEYNKYA